jgi:hypothetical protein
MSARTTWRTTIPDAGSGKTSRDSPSRDSFRPPSQQTVRFRVRLIGRASTYRQPVLGAGQTLGQFGIGCKPQWNVGALLRLSHVANGHQCRHDR